MSSEELKFTARIRAYVSVSALDSERFVGELADHLGLGRPRAATAFDCVKTLACELQALGRAPKSAGFPERFASVMLGLA